MSTPGPYQTSQPGHPQLTTVPARPQPRYAPLSYQDFRNDTPRYISQPKIATRVTIGKAFVIDAK